MIIFTAFEIEKKNSISFNNATNNNATIEYLKNYTRSILKKLFYVRCVCHIINLSVKNKLSS